MLDHYCTDSYFVGMKVAIDYGSMLYCYCLHKFMLHKLHKVRVILTLFALAPNLHKFLLVLVVVVFALVALASS